MIPLFKVWMSLGATDRVTKVLSSGFIGQGPVVDEFERALEDTFEREMVTMSSCTAAIHAVLTHLGVGPGHEVITTPVTCVASNAPIIALGARPVWADIDPETGLIDPESVEKLITGRTRAIIGVNWTGRRVLWGDLRHGIPLIEDAAHGPLLPRVAEWHEPDYTCYSFGPIKHLTCGDGGAVSTPDPENRASLRLLRWYGLDRTSSRDFRCEQNIIRPGMKWHMNDINAAIGLGNLPSLRNLVWQHRAHARQLWEGLQGTWVKMVDYDEDSNYWVFPILLDNQIFRDKFRAYLAENGIMSSQVHARNDKNFGYNYYNGVLPGVTEFDSRQLNLPCGWWLEQKDIDHVIKVVKAWVP